MLDDTALDILFRKARTHRRWQDRAVTDAHLQQVFDLMKMAPTSGNCSPARIAFVRSPEAKARLKPALSEGNVEQTMTAPVTAILAYDLKFYDLMPKLLPHNPDARGWFADDPQAAEVAAFRNGSLQGAYFILAARAVGLDCGPMSGFDNAKVDNEFFHNSSVKSNFLCNLGFGDPARLHPRSPRLDFAEACKVL
ncbi:malonic semialdehyde reductase [Ferrovibrio sp.]|uniref:malonic semialdehyde reductase n=1 Tax=Ferrovibrio sp. TaxID=1917215 RepID=UPI00311EE525